MPQANVYTSVSGQAWYSDKVRVNTGNTSVTLQVEAVQLTYKTPIGIVTNAGNAVGNIYSAPMVIPANSKYDTYVGVGNRLTIVGSNYTALELGTASSATAGVNGVINY
jgi:hypothetical protein